MSYSTKTDKKWQKKWEESRIYKFDRKNLDKNFIVLKCFHISIRSKTPCWSLVQFRSYRFMGKNEENAGL